MVGVYLIEGTLSERQAAFTIFASNIKEIKKDTPNATPENANPRPLEAVAQLDHLKELFLKAQKKELNAKLNRLLSQSVLTLAQGQK